MLFNGYPNRAKLFDSQDDLHYEVCFTFAEGRWRWGSYTQRTKHRRAFAERTCISLVSGKLLGQ